MLEGVLLWEMSPLDAIYVAVWSIELQEGNKIVAFKMLRW